MIKQYFYLIYNEPLILYNLHVVLFISSAQGMLNNTAAIL
jgi:hypothetical protein